MPGVVWAGTDDGNLQVSRDDGATFTEVGGELPACRERNHVSTGSRASTRRISTRRPRTSRSTAIAATISSRTSSSRTTTARRWTNIAGKLPPYGNIQVVREDPKNKDLLYAGTEFGLYISLDARQAVGEVHEQHPTVRMDDILIHPRDNDLIVATHGAEPVDRGRHHAAAAVDAGGRARTCAVRRAARDRVSVRLSARTADVGGQKRFEGENRAARRRRSTTT